MKDDAVEEKVLGLLLAPRDGLLERRRIQGSLTQTIVSSLERLRSVNITLVDSLEHSLQTATRAYRANASDGMVLGALLHDLLVDMFVRNHGKIAAEIIAPFVSEDAYQSVRTHSEFTLRLIASDGDILGTNAETRRRLYADRDPYAYLRYKNESWFDAAMRFNAEWHEPAMIDASYDTMRLEEFVPLLDQYFTSKEVARLDRALAVAGER
jgi:hypothetical protein